MSSAALHTDVVQVPHQPAIPRVGVRLPRIAILFCSLSLIFLPEYAQSLGDISAKNPLYHTVVGGFRLIDVLVLLSGISACFALGCSRDRLFCFPRKLAVLLAAFAVAIGISALYGIEHGGQNLCFDWRAIALGVAFYFVYRLCIQTAFDMGTAISVFGMLVALRVGSSSVSYVLGNGANILGLRIPLFDGPSLSAIVFASLLATSLSACDPDSRRRWLWLLLSGAAILLVALCFRRTYWAELAIGLVLLATTARGHRLRSLAVPLFAAAIAFAVLGSSLTERLSSVDFTRDDAPYGEDNPDHVGDILDAWTQVRTSPVMGIGLGRSYETWHIRQWKDESVMVHNAPLHVWLKYGLFGLAVYLAYHFCLFQSLRGQARSATPLHRAVLNSVLAYLAAQFVVSLGFTPWPYSAVQSTNLIAFLLAVAFVREPLCHYQASPSLRPLTTRRHISLTQSPA